MGSADGAAECGGDEARGLLEASRAAGVSRLMNRHVLPIFLVMATLCYIDRTNTAFASLQMTHDLQFDAATYGLGSGLFFVSYSAAMIPSQYVLMHVGAPRWLAIIVTVWGLTAMSFAFMTNKVQFFTLRALLGLAEAGAFPGMWHYLNQMYAPEHITLPYSLVEAAVGLANVAGAPLAASLLLLDGQHGWHGWQWLFLLEGLPSVACGITMAYVLPRDFHACSFLSSQDKAWLAQALASHKKHAQEAEGQGFVHLLLDAARNSRIWVVGAAALLKNAAMVGVLFWAPFVVSSLLKGTALDMAAVSAAHAGAGAGHGRHLLSGTPLQPAPGGRGVAAVLLTAVPFISAALCAVWLGHRSQLARERSRHVAWPYLCAAGLFTAFPAAASCGGLVAFLCLVGGITTLTAPNAILNSLASAVSSGPSAAMGLALYNSIGNLGGLLGPWLIGRVVQATGLYASALQVLGCMVAGASALAFYTKRWAL